MKHKKLDYTKKPWTPFEPILGPPGDSALHFANSRYHVALYWEGDDNHPLGHWAHLSVKDHGRSARHDWRDFQRIKNELIGPECEAIELYPAETRLVDTCNQYHLFVFATWRPPVGFKTRLVADGQTEVAPNAVQRPFERRPPDCLDGPEFDRYALRVFAGVK